jgi:predicted nucleotidyltransferase
MRKREQRACAKPEGRLALVREALTGDRSVVFAYLFGGYGRRGRAGPLSDVDIAVYLDPTVDAINAKLDLIGKVSEALDSDEIDLVILNTAPLSLAGRVQHGGQILVDKNPETRHVYESLIRRQFADFRFQEEKVLNRRFGLG